MLLEQSARKLGLEFEVATDKSLGEMPTCALLGGTFEN